MPETTGKNRTCDLKVEKWDIDDDADGGICFYCCGIDQEKNSVCVKIEGFLPHLFVQLPKKRGLDWRKREQNLLFSYFTNFACKRDPPVSFEVCDKFFLKGKVPVKAMRLEFLTIKGMRDCARSMENRAHTIQDLGKFEKKELRTHEQNVDTFIKFFTFRDLSSAGCISVLEKKGISYEKISKADKEYICDWKNVKKCDKEFRVEGTIMSFDIEAYSRNHAAFPDPNDKENIITQIATTTQRRRTGETVKTVLSLGGCLSIPGVKVLNFANEKALLRALIDHISEENPDVILGYNSLKFDWNYIMVRAEKNGLFRKLCSGLSRIFSLQAREEKLGWKSSAYGTQEFKFLEIPGISQIDMYIEFERNHKLDKNTLDYVSEHFLGEHKKDVTAKELFKVMELSMFFESLRKKMSFRDLRRRLYQKVFLKFNTEFLLKFRNSIKNAKNESELDLIIRSGVTKLADYCVQDTVLPLRLLQHLDTLLNVDMLADVFCVPRTYLQTRGQQVKVLSMMYKEMQKEDLVVEFRGYEKEVVNVKYKGGAVFPAKKGDWEDVLVWDFESLYPSEVISRNIDYTTYCTEDESVPDSECNIVEWDQHEFCSLNGCPLDSKVGIKKKKDEEIVCGHFKQRFKKATVLPNGEIVEGVLPRMLRRVLTRRKMVKAEMEEFKKRASEETEPEKKAHLLSQAKIKNATQLALKVSANSAYGILGATAGIAPLIGAAAAVTTSGRKDIQGVVEMIQERWPQGELVYGDTDSCMIHFPAASPKELIEFGEMVGAEISKYLTPPMNLQFEKLYKRYVLLSKKRYVGTIVNKSGKVLSLDKKGVVLTRRDNCHFVRELFETTVKAIIDKEEKSVIKQNVCDSIYLMMAKAIPDQKYVIYKSIKGLGEYKNGGEKLSNVALAKKMIARGDEVIPNTRLEFVFLHVPKTKGKKVLQTEQIEDFSWYLENKKRYGLRIDTHLYLEKKVTKPIAELLSIWETEKIPFEKLADRIKRLETLVSREDKDPMEKLNYLFVKQNLDDCIPEKVTEEENGKKYKQTTIPFAKEIRIKNLKERANNIAKQFEYTEKEVVSLLIESYIRRKHMKTLDRIRKYHGIPAVRQPRPGRKGVDFLVRNGKILQNLAKAHLAYSEVLEKLKKMFSRPVIVEEEKDL